MKAIACFVFFMCAAFTAQAREQYFCRDFVADFKAVRPTDKMSAKSNANLASSAGFLMGAYFSKTGEDFESPSQNGLGEFERAVIADCTAHPNDRVPVTVLRVIAAWQTKAPTEKPVNDQAGYTVTELTDLKLDAKQLQGKKVEVTGVLMTMGDVAMIGDSLFSNNKIFVDSHKLSRENRKYIIENCGSSCTITIRGKVGTVMLNDGIIADDIVNK